MKLFSQNNDETEQSEKEDDTHYDYDCIATPCAIFTGAIHSSGEAYVEVEQQYGGDNHIGVRGSVNHTGHAELDIYEKHELENELPEPANDPQGFTSVVKDKIRVQGEVHNSSRLDINIKKLVIIPSDPVVMVAMHNAGFEVYDQISFYGSIHSVGEIHAHIGNLYVYPTEDE